MRQRPSSTWAPKGTQALNTLYVAIGLAPLLDLPLAGLVMPAANDAHPLRCAGGQQQFAGPG